MPNHGAGGRPKKPNSLHVLEGTARADRGTDVVVSIPEDQAVAPKDINWESFKRDEMFDMLENWVVHMTGAAKIDSILLTMMTDLLEVYAEAKAIGDTRGMGATIDRFHKLAREFGMTPSTRDSMVKAAEPENNPIKDVMAGP